MLCVCDFLKIKVVKFNFTTDEYILVDVLTKHLI